jgi:hypothetical protein
MFGFLVASGPAPKILKRRKKKSSGATRRIGNPHHSLGTHHFYDCPNYWSRSEVLSRTTSNVIGVSGQQSFVDLALYIKV